MLGSSPLTRGKLAIYVDVIDDEGLIPAHAGKTPRANTPRPASWAHPRSRGENATVRLIRTVTAGSSPLTRGKHGARQRTRRLSGLIPAHAGKTPKAGRPAALSAAHPRSRGENGYLSVFRVTGLGSSPLTRGKPNRRSQSIRNRGLIPAHAGKTIGPDVGGAHAGAHPRSRGENAGCCGEGAGFLGSSPLTRGKLAADEGLAACERLIPAHAGKTTRRRACLAVCRAHPRSRGENAMFDSARSHCPGSSPLTRGKLDKALDEALTGGLIPAHAGKTRRRVGVRRVGGAHPRSRGENQYGPDDGHAPPGLIPAHAGKTLPDLRFYRADRSDLGKP